MARDCSSLRLLTVIPLSCQIHTVGMLNTTNPLAINRRQASNESSRVPSGAQIRGHHLRPNRLRREGQRAPWRCLSTASRVNGFAWRDVLDDLAPTRRCIALDLMGLGYTEIKPDQDLGFDQQAAMIAAFMDRLGIVAGRSGRQRQRRQYQPGVRGALSVAPAQPHPHQLRGPRPVAQCDAESGVRSVCGSVDRRRNEDDARRARRRAPGVRVGL